MPASTEPVVVAPLERELEPFLRMIGAERVGRLPHGALYRGSSAGDDVLAAVIGDGWGRAERSLEELLAGGGPRRALLVGVAGGLAPGLVVGDLVRATRVLEAAPDGGVREWAGTAAGGAESLVGVAVTASRILVSAVEKRALWSRLGAPDRAVVDLESAVFARLAERAGLSWSVVRAVSDPQGEDLPLDFAAASDADGHVVGSRVARLLLASPAAAGRLRELSRKVDLCAQTLAEEARRWLAEGP